MLEELLFHLKNWFVKSVHYGTFAIKGGELSLPFIANGQYYRIVGSIFNDGLHKSGDSNLVDETFDGSVHTLAIPNVVIDLAKEIEAWQTKNGNSGVFQSESFGGYSYTKATDNNGMEITWQSAFRKRLNPWRKI